MNSLNQVAQDSKEVVKSIAPLLIVIVLFIIVGKFGFSQISTIRSDIKNAEKTLSILNDKLKILRSISLTAEQDSNSALTAFPKSNPVLLVLNQLRRLSAENSLVVENIISTPGSAADTSGISFVTISFDITGPRDQVMAFIKGIEKIAPITLVQKMDFTSVGDLNTVSLTTKTFYAPLPKSIPTVTQAVTDLNTSERSILSQISSLTPPIFFEPSSTTQIPLNPNPFGQ